MFNTDNFVSFFFFQSRKIKQFFLEKIMSGKRPKNLQSNFLLNVEMKVSLDSGKITMLLRHRKDRM